MPDELVDLLTTSQVARLLKVSDQWVRTLLRNGRLAHVATPLGRLIPREAVERLARERRGRRRQRIEGP
jgi:excisionase family DNA binding protein